MMIAEFLSHLAEQDIKVWVDGEQLRCNAPQGKLTPDLITQLQKRKPEILAILNQAKVGNQRPPLVAGPHDGRLPLSYAQQRLWFLGQLAGHDRAYHIPLAFMLDGVLDIDVLQSSLQMIVQRHAVLRTTYHLDEGEVYQVIAPAAAPCPLPLVPLEPLAAEAQAAALVQWQHDAGEQPFDLTQDLPLRGVLLRLAAEQHILLLTLHHIAGDGWSVGVLLDELVQCYTALVTGQPVELTPLPIQYADYAQWQRTWLQGKALTEHLAFWRQHLAGAPGLLTLPTDRPRPAEQSYRGATYHFELAPGLSQGLDALCANAGVTLFMTLLAGYKVLLHRYSGQSDLVVGTPIANRTQVEVEPLIGMFVNTLALRTDLSDDPTFRQVLDRVRRTTQAAYEHQDLPFELVVEALHPERSLSHAPLFQTMFALQNTPQPPLHLPDLQLRWLETPSQTTKFDLSLALYRTEQGLAGWWEYSTDLFDQATIARMTRNFQVLLQGVVADQLRGADQPISKLPLLTAAERWQVVVEWNATQTTDRQDQCIQHLFEAQVAQTPAAPAVCCGGEQLTYADLNARANQLAHHLRSLGVGPETLVGVCLERSLDLVISVMAIWKAGGAYVPLDPGYPAERLAFILQDAAPKVVLTQSGYQRLLPASLPLLLLDTATATIAQQPTHTPAVDVTAANLAYVIYTSGSTGWPKGALLEQRGLCNLARAQIRAFGVQPGHRVLQVASLNFDASISEMVMALCAGATLVLASADDLLPGAALTKTLQQHAITHATLVPTALALLEPEALPQLQTLIVAGEACPAVLAARWVNGRRFFNAYGPTEATVCATIMDSATWPEPRQAPPIGRPMDNVQIYILDEQRQPMPIGAPGELYIGGIGVGCGYLNRPDLTMERFVDLEIGDWGLETGDQSPIPNLQSPVPSPQSPLRLYKTGDLGRWLPDGQIEFLGRIDHQVKLRGFRIELGEIENVIQENPAVQEAVVLLREAVAGDPRLTAYVVPQTAPPAPPELWPSVAEYYVYDDLLYYAMTNDVRRNQSYQVAMRQLVNGKTVVEVGTGKDAVLAVFCAEAGAKKIYAIERDEHAVQSARARIQQLGLTEQITVIHGDATKVELPEPADICLSEIVGPIGGCEGATVILNDVRRFLKADGVMIPAQSVTKLAAVTLPDSLQQNPQFTPMTAHYTAQIFEQVGHPFDLRLCIKNFPNHHVLSDAGIFEDLDFNAVMPLQDAHDSTLTIQKDGRLDGFLVWLNLHTVAGEVIDTLAHEYCWLPVYLPVFEPSIPVRAGDVIQLTCRRWLSDNGLNPEYAIAGQLVRQQGEPIRFAYTAYHHESLFKQTPFYQRLFANYTAACHAEPSATPSIMQPGASTPLPDHQLVAALRRQLQEKLPAYMMPAAFVMLDALPRTPNGKVDRKALPAPGATLSAVTDAVAFVASRTPTETALAAIWRDLLGLTRVGVHDNFFHVGGHSLLAVQLIARIRQQFALDLPLTKLFQHPTIGALATLLQPDATHDAWSPLAPIQAAGTQTPFFCVHDISGHVHQFYPLARALGTARPFYGLQAVGVDGVATPLTSVEAMAAHYIAAIQTVQPHGPYLLGGHSLGCQIAFEMARQLTAQGDQVALLVLLDGSAPTAAPRVAQPVERVLWLLRKVEAIALWQGQAAPSVDETALRALAEAEQWERLNQVLAAAGLPRLEDDPVLVSYALFKANLEMQYAPSAALAVPAVLFTTPREAAPEPPDETLGWQRLFQQPLRCQTVPGNHFTLLQPPVVAGVAQTLAAYLAQANS